MKLAKFLQNHQDQKIISTLQFPVRIENGLKAQINLDWVKGSSVKKEANWMGD